MKEGVYRLYAKHLSDKGVSQTLVGRFIFRGNEILILEDHNRVLSEMFPNGIIDGRALRRLVGLQAGAYWDLIQEQ